MKIVFLHGRDQQRKDPVALKQQWVDSLKEGLAKSNLQLPDQVEICFPFYGNLLEKLVEESGKSIDVIARGAQSDTKEAQFYFEFLSEIAANEGITDDIVRTAGQVEIAEKGPLNWKWIRAILQALDKTKVADLSIREFTHDVFLYLTVPGIQQRINNFVRQEIGTDPCVFVSHSLGTVVAYCTLVKEATPPIHKFITIGSPLGLSAVRSRLPKPLKLPIGVNVNAGWYNAFDNRDVVALFPLTAPGFGITPPIVNKMDVNNQTSNRHGIIGYLNDPEVAMEIYRALV